MGGSSVVARGRGGGREGKKKRSEEEEKSARAQHLVRSVFRRVQKLPSCHPTPSGKGEVYNYSQIRSKTEGKVYEVGRNGGSRGLKGRRSRVEGEVVRTRSLRAAKTTEIRKSALEFNRKIKVATHDCFFGGKEGAGGKRDGEGEGEEQEAV